ATPGSGLGNVISGNGLEGVVLQGSTNNVVAGNILGLDQSGLTALANASGVYSDAANNTIGGVAAGAANVISGNANYGIRLTGTGATGNVVQGNFIGTDITGTVAKGNVAGGVRIELGAANNTIGVASAGARNVI